jgi:hypothetical protein
MLYGINRVLLNVEGGAGGGGGGTGGGGGEKPAFSQEQMDWFDARMGTAISGAITSSNRKFEERIGKLLETKLEGFKTPPVVEEEKPKKGKERENDDSVGLQTMKQTIETLRAEMETTKKERDLERQKNRAGALRSTVAENLAKIGVKDAVSQKHAIAVLKEEGLVGYEDEASDRVVWRNPDGQTWEAEMGFRQWAKTPEAQRFMEATGTRGSGGTRSNMNGVGQQAPDAKTVERNVWAVLNDELGKQ